MSAIARTAALAASLIALSVGPAAARGAKPHVRIDTPYPSARRILVAQGFDPARIVKWDTPGECQDIAYEPMCRTFPETITCAMAGGSEPCRLLFRRRADGRYWLVFTEGEPDTASAADLAGVRYQGARPASAWDLDDLDVIGPGGRIEHHVAPAIPVDRAAEDRRIPLCSQVPPHTLPCWIKPPPGYRPAHAPDS